MSKVFSIPVTIAATAYVKAESKEHALLALGVAFGGQPIGLQLLEDWSAGLPITGISYDDASLPDLSLSPAMTVYSVNMDGTPLTTADVEEAGE